MKRERAALAKQSRELLALPTKKERSQARPPPAPQPATCLSSPLQAPETYLCTC